MQFLPAKVWSCTTRNLQGGGTPGNPHSGKPICDNHLAESADFLAAYEAGDEHALWQSVVYCAGHRIPLWEWLAAELLMPWHRPTPGSLDDWHSNPAMPTGEK